MHTNMSKLITHICAIKLGRRKIQLHIRNEIKYDIYKHGKHQSTNKHLPYVQVDYVVHQVTSHTKSESFHHNYHITQAND